MSGRGRNQAITPAYRHTITYDGSEIEKRISAPATIQNDALSLSYPPPPFLSDYMLSVNPPTPQSALLVAAQQPIVPQESSFDDSPWRAANEVVPRVYLTDLLTARNEAQLSALGINHPCCFGPRRCSRVPRNVFTSDVTYTPLGQRIPRHPCTSPNYHGVHPRCTC